MSSTAMKLYSSGPFGRFWRWQYKLALLQFSSATSSSSTSTAFIGIGSESVSASALASMNIPVQELQVQNVPNAMATATMPESSTVVPYELNANAKPKPRRREKSIEEMEKWKRVMQIGRRMPWSTSKARKLFQVSEGEAAAEQTNPLEEKLMMSDRHSVGSLGKLQEAKKSFQLTSQKDLDEIIPVVTLAIILMGKMMRSSIPNLTTLEIVSQEEL